MKNFITSLKDKNISQISNENETYSEPKSTNINILLNRVKLDKRKESRKKIIFSTVASLGILLFGAMIF